MTHLFKAAERTKKLNKLKFPPRRRITSCRLILGVFLLLFVVSEVAFATAGQTAENIAAKYENKGPLPTLVYTHEEQIRSDGLFNTEGSNWPKLPDGSYWTKVPSEIKEKMLKANKAIRIKRLFYTPNYRFGYMMIGAGARYPKHKHAAAEYQHILSGKAKWTVDGKIIEATPGTTIYIKPNSVVSIDVLSGEPMKSLWGKWAPNGDAKNYLDTGYEMLEDFTGFPKEAELGDIEFFAGTKRKADQLSCGEYFKTHPVEEYRYTQEEDIKFDDLVNYDDENYAKDEKLREKVKAIDRVFRMKHLLFMPDSSRFGTFIVGSKMYYPKHHHPCPEFYHIVSGTTKWTVDDKTFIAGPGTTIYMRPHAVHAFEVISDEPAKTVWAQWGPNGDMSTIDNSNTLIEPIPDYPEQSDLGNLQFYPLSTVTK